MLKVKICKYCSSENRQSAKYCKDCGKPFDGKSISTPLLNIVDREEIKESITALCKSFKSYKNEWDSEKGFNASMILSGASGSGKTTTAKLIAEELFINKITKKKKPVIIDSSEFETKVNELDKIFLNAKGGILFIDNVHKFISTSGYSGLNNLDRLVHYMDKYNRDPMVIIAGINDEFDNYLNDNPAIVNRFEYYFSLRDFLPSELYSICKNKIEDFGLELEENSAEKLLSLFKHELKQKKTNYTNGHFAVNIAEDISRRFYEESNDSELKTIKEFHIPGKIPKPKSLNQIFAELDELIGLEKVKASLREIAAFIQHQKKLDNKKTNIGFHIVLTGNPGTGKTMIARKLGEVLEGVGYLEQGHVVEVDKSDLVAQYVGQTPQNVQKKCDEAMGGVLFIDEAYSLGKEAGSGTSNSFGREAIDTLLKRMEDERDKFVVVAAGYRNEMQRFINSNPGLKSRFDRYIHIDDYNSNELFEIFHYFVRKNNYKITKDASELVREMITELYNKRDKNFANAREVRKIFETSLINLSKRVITDNSKESDLITIKDIPFKKEEPQKLDELMSELNKLTGLQSIKKEIHKLSSLLKAEKKRKEILGEELIFDYHFVFMGNPGTGKTTVARLLGKIFKSLGLLSSGHTIEVQRSDLVASFIGQTSEKTNQVIDTAMGGILFIDEAYSLVVKDSPKDFGSQSIQTILKRMEDDKGKFVLIVAGYPNEMKEFLESNPGLDSRFRKKITFEDFNADELFDIYKMMSADKKLKLSSDAEASLKNKFEIITSSKGKNFGNGRTVRNLFLETLENQSFRIAELLDRADFDSDKLFLIEKDDVPK
jgi:SpoVK/Ycf46/Vps4 family AAA+-type ATPase